MRQAGSRRATGTPKHGYHHGDLRRALVDAALALIGERNHAELSLREVARRAGVSYAAPYHHFPDKSALVAAVAGEGFDELVSRMEAAVARRKTLRSELLALSEAYLAFALQRPSHYRVMFLPEVKTVAGSDALHVAGDRALTLLMERVKRARPKATAREHERVAVTVWSTLHGLALLSIDGTIQNMFPQHDRMLAQVCESVVAMVMGG
jgi:AcrR family transcriptional regulator